jgi:hypothetical protein
MGYAFLDSEDCVAVGCVTSGQGLYGAGLHFQNSARGMAFGCTADGNGISGFDFFNSPNGRFIGCSARANTVRGFEIDSASNDCEIIGGTSVGNGDVDVSVFRSSGARITGDHGTLRIWDYGVLGSVAVAAGGSGWAVNDIAVINAGTGLSWKRCKVRVTTVLAGVVTGLAIEDAGDQWTIPANPVAFAPVAPATGTGLTVNITWAGINSDLCARANINGGNVTSALTIIAGSSSLNSLSQWRGTVSDPGLTIQNAVACTNYFVPPVALSLQNSWVNDNAALYTPAQYSIDSDGWVTVEGQIKNGTVAANTLIATLPVGFRPAQEERSIVLASGANGACYIGTDGTIRDLGGSFSATWSRFSARFRRA